MATGKRFYWIKLKDTFMTSDAVDFLMGQKDGANYVVLYQMLCLKTANTEGRLERKIGEVIIPYDVEKIARDSKWFSVDTVRVALELYKALGLVYVDEEGCLVMANHSEMVGCSKTDEHTKMLGRERQQRFRENQKKQLEENNIVTVTQDVTEDVTLNRNADIRDKRLDIRDKDIRDKDIREKKTDAFVVYAGSDKKMLQALKDFEEMRKKIKKPLTDKAKELLINKLKDYPIEEQIPVIEQSVERAWAGIYDLKKESKKAEEKVTAPQTYEYLTRGQLKAMKESFKKERE